jgi:hypothetical protein
MGTEFRFGLMEQSTKATGDIIKHTVKELFGMQKEIFMKVIS